VTILGFLLLGRGVVAEETRNLLGRKVNEAKKKTPTPHFPQDTHRWGTISIPASLPHPQMPQITSFILPLSPLTGKILDKNQG